MRAEDVLQQVYVKVLTGKARFEGKGSFKTWLFGVIRRTAGEDHRRQWGRRLILARYWEGLMGAASPGSAAGALPSEACEAGELREAFGAALLALPPRQSEVLHLVFYQELSISGAAEVMGISVGSARTHYERGKKALRATLAPFDDSRELTHVQPIA
jgi:RNA polymerase sigma-70 factor (ECF subfamily)